MVAKLFPLGDSFLVGIARFLKPGSSGFWLTASYLRGFGFAWERCEIDRPGHAIKPDENGEMELTYSPTGGGREIEIVRFLTDVSIKVNRGFWQIMFRRPGWQIDILEGSVVRLLP